MNLPMRMILFFTVFVVMTALTHRYLYVRMVRDMGLPPPWLQAGRRLFIGLGLAMLLGLAAFRFLPPHLGLVTAYAVFCWMGLLAILLPVTVLIEPVRILSRLWQRRVSKSTSTSISDEPKDPGRRQALSRMTAVATTVGSASIASAGVHTALSPPLLRELDVSSPHLPEAFDGFRIVQLSDVHVGPTIGRDFTLALRDRIATLDADLVVITGDLVDGSVDNLRDAVAPLGELKSRLGTFFCTGNHDYYSDDEAWCEELSRIGIRSLRNERVSLTRSGSNDGPSIDLYGLDDYSSRSRKTGAPGHDPKKAFADRDLQRFALVLAHQPRAVFDCAAAGADLVLSGHTHGGQIWPYGYLVALIQPYVQGLHAHGERTQIYVNSGTGYWGPPVRVRVPSEVTLFTLRRGGPSSKDA